MAGSEGLEAVWAGVQFGWAGLVGWRFGNCLGWAGVAVNISNENEMACCKKTPDGVYYTLLVRKNVLTSLKISFQENCSPDAIQHQPRDLAGWMVCCINCGAAAGAGAGGA